MKKLISLLSISLIVCSCSATPNSSNNNTTPSSSSSTNPTPASGTIDLVSSIKTKDELINAYKCAVSTLSDSKEKSDLTLTVGVLTAMELSNFSNKDFMETNIKPLKSYNLTGCNLKTGTIGN